MLPLRRGAVCSLEMPLSNSPTGSDGAPRARQGRCKTARPASARAPRGLCAAGPGPASRDRCLSPGEGTCVPFARPSHLLGRASPSRGDEHVRPAGLVQCWPLGPRAGRARGCARGRGGSGRPSTGAWAAPALRTARAPAPRSRGFCRCELPSVRVSSRCCRRDATTRPWLVVVAAPALPGSQRAPRPGRHVAAPGGPGLHAQHSGRQSSRVPTPVPFSRTSSSTRWSMIRSRRRCWPTRGRSAWATATRRTSATCCRKVGRAGPCHSARAAFSLSGSPVWLTPAARPVRWRDTAPAPACPPPPRLQRPRGPWVGWTPNKQQRLERGAAVTGGRASRPHEGRLPRLPQRGDVPSVSLFLKTLPLSRARLRRVVAVTCPPAIPAWL